MNETVVAVAPLRHVTAYQVVKGPLGEYRRALALECGHAVYTTRKDNPPEPRRCHECKVAAGEEAKAP